tara:strand:+ start:1317 stop:1772 length:456 start_codon:yes stop_codon:yes gene_type:complete
MDLSSIKPKVANKKTKRVGRGTGTGRGKTSTRGHKGAGQRKGKKTPYPGYRGGSLTFARLLPKRGFTPVRKRDFQVVNLGDIQTKLGEIKEINPEVLKEKNLIKSIKKPVKILAKIQSDFSLKVTIKADKFSLKAKEVIEKAGGVAECLSR